MKRIDHENLEQRKQEIEARIGRRNWEDQPAPMFSRSNAVYEMSGRIRATPVGGIGAVHQMIRRLRFDRRVDESLVLLKRHLPYHESDHVLNIAYNVMSGATKLEDIELLRHDAAYMDMLGAERIPDPTTAGDFLRRPAERDIETLMDETNEVRTNLWRKQPRSFRHRATIDVDGTITPTDGEKKAGMGLSYNGIWGYHPLIVSLANTKEPLFIVNRPGNHTSQSGCVEWIEKAIELCKGTFQEVWLRGDTAFSLTSEFDGWTERGVKFVFGYDATPNLVKLASEVPESHYDPLPRKQKPVKTRRRQKRKNTKEAIVEEKGYRNIRLESEQWTEVEYTPAKCSRPYRLVIVRKNLTIEEGGLALFDDVKFFFYICNDYDRLAREVIAEAHERCDQENVIEQLKNGVNALRVPLNDLVSNWAYMVIASLAWTFKAWFGLMAARAERDEIIRMEFKKFLNTLIRVPCQVIKGARRIRIRILTYTERVHLLLGSSPPVGCRSGP